MVMLSVLHDWSHLKGSILRSRDDGTLYSVQQIDRRVEVDAIVVTLGPRIFDPTAQRWKGDLSRPMEQITLHSRTGESYFAKHWEFMDDLDLKAIKGGSVAALRALADMVDPRTIATTGELVGSW